MTAYITGIVGECEVGDKEQLIFENEVEAEDQELFEDIVMQKPDEHGCYRPCALGSDRNGEPNSVEIYFDDRPTKEIVSTLKNRAMKYIEYVQNNKTDLHNYPSKIHGFRMESEETVTTRVEDLDV